ARAASTSSSFGFSVDVCARVDQRLDHLALGDVVQRPVRGGEAICRVGGVRLERRLRELAHLGGKAGRGDDGGADDGHGGHDTAAAGAATSAGGGGAALKAARAVQRKVGRPTAALPASTN